MADLRTQLQDGLAGSYALERELGRGGMATVFLARDLKHDRPVALKVLHPELAASLGPERFLREIHVAARLQHPHILTVLDSGDVAGRLWFTMPYVEGESLRDRLRRERQLPVEDALRIAREAAQALQYAHEHGVIHRDLKPENLLLTRDGNTLVADFGIARALGASGDERLTETGLAVGTPAYMSPEQAAGDRNLDARTDVYSLGAVLYEMLAGEPPYTGATTQAMLVKRLTEPAPSVRAVRPTVPEEADRAIRKALAPVPADRFGGMAQFGAALMEADRRTGGPADVAPTTVQAPSTAATVSRSARPPVRLPLAATTLVLGILIGLGVLFAWRRAGEPARGDGPVRLAVLPFENLGDSADAYFADGVSDAVRGKLTGLPGVQVIARGSSVQYAGAGKTPREIAAELGVRYLLTGTVRWAKPPGGVSRVQVSPELVEVTGEGAAASQWQQSFEGPLTDVFALQANIAGQVARAMQVALPGTAQERLQEAPTSNPAAYDALLRARAATAYGAKNAPADLRLAIRHYEEAIKLDSTFVAAWGELSSVLGLLYANSIPTPELARRAREAAERCLALDPQSVEAARAMAGYYINVEIDPVRAAAQLESAVRKAPGDAGLRGSLGNVARSLGRFDEALEHAQAAYALDPRLANRAGAVAHVLLWMRRPSDARPMAERSLALAPTSLVFIQRLAMTALAEGDLAAARRVLAGATEADRSALAAYMAYYWDLGWALDDAGQRLALSLGPEAYDDNPGARAIVRAQLYAWRGDSAASRAWGDSAQRHLATLLRNAPDDPQLLAIRGLALAYAGRAAEGIATAERGTTLLPISKDAEIGTYLAHQLARVYAVGGQPEKAVAQLERLLSVPYYITAAWLRIDPDYASLREHPGFIRLIGSTGPGVS